MKKLLYLAPHLSTGGMPQYVVRLVETLQNDYEIYVIEYHDISPDYVVQKNTLKRLLGNHMITLYGTDKEKETLFFYHIGNIHPDIIHLQEIPEMCLTESVSNRLYSKNRKYTLIETSHDSGFNIDDKRYFPDSFAFISEFHPRQYAQILVQYNIPYEIVEYPIDRKERPDRTTALTALGLDPTYKHVLNVGLFTPRKNQAEIFEMAKLCKGEKIQFHFVGNHADNFRFYWEPLLKDVPENCKIWNERADVDQFYSAMDLFLFTSRGHDTDRETNPIVLKEALSWQMPVIMYNLSVYCGMYDGEKDVHWIQEDNLEGNVEALKSILIKEEKIMESKTKLFHVDYVKEENKFIFQYLLKETHALRVSIKDIDSRTCIWAFDFTGNGPGSNCWCVPTPINIQDYYNDPIFGGVRIEYFENDVLLDYDEFRIKEISIHKPVLDLSNYEPINLNYHEFFIEKVYDKLPLQDLNIVFDIGANIGLWTKFILLQGAKKVFCFEPNINALKDLHRNLKADNVVIVDKAIYTENTELEFHTVTNNSTISSIYTAATDMYGNNTEKKSYKVGTVTLENAMIACDVDYVDLVKFDIEGPEFDILESLPERVFDRINAFMIEEHSQYFPEGNTKVQDLIALLMKRGYMVYKAPLHKIIYAQKLRQW